MKELLDIVQAVGLPAALVIFFVWQGGKREQRTIERQTATDDYIRETLSGIVQRNTAALTSSTESMEHHTASSEERNKEIGALVQELRQRPCMVPRRGGAE